MFHMRQGIASLFFALAVCVPLWGMEPPAGGLAPLPAIAPQWRAMAYQGMIDRINPKHVNNVKFLFLGDPVPALVQKYGNSTALYGYGGLVAVRKKSFLGLVLQSVRFYLVDASGALIKFTPINEMEGEAVSPEMYHINITVTGEYKPNPDYTPPPEDKKGKPGRKPGRHPGGKPDRREPEYIWVATETKTIAPTLDAYQEERLNAFNNTHIDRQPVYQ